jgi:hypothetical protein
MSTVVIEGKGYSFDYNIKYFAYDKEEICFIMVINDRYALAIAPLDDPTNLTIYHTSYSGYNINKIYVKHENTPNGVIKIYSVKVLFYKNDQLHLCKISTPLCRSIHYCNVKTKHEFKFYDEIVETDNNIYVVIGSTIYNFTTGHYIFNVESYTVTDKLEYTCSKPKKSASEILATIMPN